MLRSGHSMNMQHPLKFVPLTSGSRRHRKWFVRHLASTRGIYGVFLLSIFFVGYWISQVRNLDEGSSWLTWSVKASQGVAPIADDEFHPYDEIEISDVIDLNLIERLNSTRTVFYVLCAEYESLNYVQYLSLASVIRNFAPSRLVFLVESGPVRLEPGQWSYHLTLEDLLRPCPAYQGWVRMRNASLVCKDPAKMHEFVMKLLLQFGGLYVGRRTFMTELASFMRETFIEEHILFHLTDDAEGFVYIRKPLSSYENQSISTTDPVPLHPAGKPRSSNQMPPKVRYLTSRQLSCLDSTDLADEVLYTNEGNIKHPCLVIREQVKLDPWTVVQLKTDFGGFARKAVHNIYNSEETMYFMRATNTSVTPPLCSALH